MAEDNADRPDTPADESPEVMSGNFRIALEILINRHSMEKGSDTPDFILAAYLMGCIKIFDSTVARRENWYGREVGKWAESHSESATEGKDNG